MQETTRTCEVCHQLRICSITQPKIMGLIRDDREFIKAALPSSNLSVNIPHRSKQYGKDQGKKCARNYLGPAQAAASQPVHYQRQYRGQNTG